MTQSDTTQENTAELPRYRIGARFEIAPVLPDVGVLGTFVKLRCEHLWVQSAYGGKHLRSGALVAMQLQLANDLVGLNFVERLKPRALIVDDDLWAPSPVRRYAVQILRTVRDAVFRSAEDAWLVHSVEPCSPRKRTRGIAV